MLISPLKNEITAIVAPLMRANINTDIIMPQTELVTTLKSNLGKGIFARWRYSPDGRENPEFVLNQPKYRRAKILLADENFGCGSSREHAVWGMLDFGIQYIIAPSFAEIFGENACRNKLLLIEMGSSQVQALAKEAAEADQEYFITISLNPAKVLTNTGFEFAFQIDKYRYDYYTSDQNFIENTLMDIDAIQSFQQKDRLRKPWLYHQN